MHSLRRGLLSFAILVHAFASISRAAIEDSRYSNTIAHVSAFITNAMNEAGVVGLSIALVDSNRIVWARGFGFADVESAIAADENTIYGICSVSKTFAAAATLQAQEMGALALDEPVTNHVPAFRLQPRFGGPPITIRNLLNHTSGLPGTYFNHGETVSPVMDYHTFVLNWLAKDYPNFPRGFANAYNNNGFTMIEEVIPGATGTNFPEFVTSNLFARMGMTNSSYFGPVAGAESRLAQSYAGSVRLPPEFLDIAASGGIYTPVVDMAQYIMTLLAWGESPLGGRVLQSNSVAMLWADETTNVTVKWTEKTFRPGLGWDCIDDPQLDYAGVARGKNGGAETFGSMLQVMPDRGLGVIVLSTCSGPAVAQPVALEALRWALKDKFGLDWPTNRFVPSFSPTTNLPVAELDAVTGCYAITEGYDLVRRDGTNLTWIRNAQNESPTVATGLVARESGWFSSPDSQDLEIRFTNVAGRIVMLLHAVTGTYGTYQETMARGRRVEPMALSAAWSGRLERLYLPVDLCANSYYWLPVYDLSMGLLEREGAIFLASEGLVNSALLSPDSDSLAFPNGVASAEPTALQAFTTNGIEYLRYGGFTYQAADSFSELQPGTSTNLLLSAGETMWLTLSVSSGTVCTLDVTSTNQVAAYVFDEDGSRVGKLLTSYGLTFTAATNSDYRIAVVGVSPDPMTCRLASYTNGLPFHREALPEEVPVFMTNQWYGGSEFGYVYVPASRATNDVHSYRIPVVQLASGPDATNGPLVYLSGGPGSSAISQVFLFAPFTNTCSVILMNQRGTYLSQPDLFPLSDDETTLELQQRLGGPDGMDFNTINTRENAADVHDVMAALNYTNQFNVWGTSYGTMLSQEVMRQHPDRIRGVVLDGVVKLDQPQWTTMGQSFLDAVVALTNDVGQDADANRLYPDFGGQFYDFAAGIYPDDYSEFFSDVFHQMNLSRWGYPENIPSIVWRAARGEDAALGELHAVRVLVANPSPDGPLSGNMYAMMLRHDMLPFESMTNAAALTNSVPFPLNEHGYAYSQDQYDSTADWDFVTPVDASFRTAATNDVPVLVLNGRYDTQTSLRSAKHVATNLPHAYYVELPYIGHATLFGGDVPAQIARDFLTNPNVFPDTNGITGLSLTFAPPWTTNDAVLTPDGTPRTNSWNTNAYGVVGIWYRFAAVAAERYVLEVGSPAVPFTLNIVDTNANVATSGTGPSTSWTCPESGDYYAWLVGDGAGTFTVALSGITNDLVEGESVTGDLAAAQTTWFHCSTTSGQYYGVVVTGVSAGVSLQLVSESLGFITNRAGGQLGWTSLDDAGYNVGFSSTGNTPFVLRFYSLTNMIAVARTAVTGYMARFNIPGVSVAVVDGDQIAWIEHFGLADSEQGKPVDSNTVFMIGSLSKSLTAILALQFFDEGTLDLDASVTNYIHEFSLLPRFDGFPTNITARNMLDHHSGLPGDIYNGAVSLIDRYWPGYTEWLIDYFSGDYALYPPNTLASYCNSGFNIVAEILARLDGTNFPALAEVRLFGPLSMTHSSFAPGKTAVMENLATGYVGTNATPVPPQAMNMPATGGAFSRAEDIARVMVMLLNEGSYDGLAILTTNALAQMDHKADLPLDVSNYLQPGLGLDTAADSVLAYAGRTWAKNGSIGFFESYMEVLPDQGLGCIALMNTSCEATYGIVRAALKAALAEKAGLAPPAIPPMDFTPTNRTSVEFTRIYVTLSGPERFVGETNGTLTCVSIGLTSNVVSTGYQALVNGRFSVPDHTNLQYAFTNVAGQDLLMRYGDDGSIVAEMIYDRNMQAMYGSLFVPPSIPLMWATRVGKTWLVCNPFADDVNVLTDSPITCTLHLTNGILRFVGTPAVTVLAPADDDTAYAAGLGTRAGGAVRVLHTNGIEQLQFSGYRYMRLDDVPALTSGVPVSGTSLFHEGNWYRADLPIGTFTLTCSDTNITMLFYTDLDNAPEAANGTHTFALTSPGTIYVALVTMSSTAPYELDAGRATLLIDEAQATPDGMVLTWISQPGTNYVIELATNLLTNPAFLPYTDNIPSAADVTTTWTAAPPAGGAAYYRVVEEEP